MGEDITIRPLTKDDWMETRDLRLDALENHPDVFCSSLDNEQAYTREDWQDWLNGDEKCMFGLFDGKNMIGLTGVVTDRDDPAGETVLLVASYIKPDYRRQGLSRLLYEARINWAYAQPHIKTIKVSHRAGNEPSRRANQAFNFQKTGESSREWPDGKQEKEILYKLKI